MLTMVARYRGPSTPWWVFLWLAMGPLAAAVAWVPWLRKRRWVCVAVACGLTLAIVVPAVVVAMTKGSSKGYDY
jgi:hypothetical protein